MARASTSMAFRGISGKLAGVVVTPGKSGTVVRRRPVYRYRPSEVQQQNSERLKAANAAWSALTPAQADAWNRFAETQARTGFDGTIYYPSGHNAFSALATKLLQVDAESPIPTMPPAGPFLGDDIELTISPSSSRQGRDEEGVGGRRQSGNKELSHPSPPSSRQTETREGAGIPPPCWSEATMRRGLGGGDDLNDFDEEAGLVFTATAPNSAEVVTELMVQPLASGLRKPTDRYRLAEFFAFQPGELERFVPLEAGWYAAAWRQVNRVTGQATGVMPLGKVEVS